MGLVCLSRPNFPTESFIGPYCCLGHVVYLHNRPLHPSFGWHTHNYFMHPTVFLLRSFGVVSLILTKIPIAVENYCEMGCAYDFCTKPLSTLWARSIGPLRLA